jgi:hypothetical protein
MGSKLEALPAMRSVNPFQAIISFGTTPRGTKTPSISWLGMECLGPIDQKAMSQAIRDKPRQSSARVTYPSASSHGPCRQIDHWQTLVRALCCLPAFHRAVNSRSGI